MLQWHDVGMKEITGLLFSSAAACVKGGFPFILPGFPDDLVIDSKENIMSYVRTPVNERADYLKIFINDEQLPKQKCQQIIKNEGELKDRLSVARSRGSKA